VNLPILLLTVTLVAVLALFVGWWIGRRSRNSWPDSLPSPRLPRDEQERKRRDFVANVSHELRTPVSIIKGFSETLLQDFDSLKEGDRKKFLEKIQRNSGRLHSLVEDLLSLARLDSPESGFEKQNCDLKLLIERATDDFKSGMGEDSIAINLKIPEGNFSVHGDEDRLLSIFQNLLENASVHAQGLSKISISLEREGDSFICKVEDDGQGIPEEDLPRVFERFYRVDKGRSRQRGGTGLGLSIVREVVEAHGGSIRVQSKQGAGSIFLVRLPSAS
jgi:two-component system phosphate regulon sensor histidine kinase PhoR